MTFFRRCSWLCLVVVSSSLAITGCDTSNTEPQTFQYQSRLLAFDNCSELQSYLLQTAELERQLQQYVFDMPVMETWQNDGVLTTESGSPGAADTTQPESSIVDYTGTNNQVSGVDEADFIKTDGEYTYILSGGYFLIFDTWPADQSQELARVEMDGYPIDLFIDQDTAWIVSHDYQNESWQAVAGFAPRVNLLTQVSLLDISDRNDPQLLRRVSMEGSYLGARLIDHRVHLVVTSYLDLSAMIENNNQTSLEDLLPALLDESEINPETPAPELISDCASFYRPQTANGTGTLSLLTFDLLNPMADIPRQSLLSNSGQIYANSDHLYIASREDQYWAWLPVMEGDDQPHPGTTIHKFAIDASPQYLASGRVQGYPLNQFSMDEYAGLLRVATTDNAWWSDQDPQNSVYILQQDEEVLEQRSVLSGLGKPGETIFAVRFIEERGFVVTYQQIDPLYSLDLSDPDHPQVAGELEVPGFSTYLHPIDDNHLLAIGRSDTNDSIKLSLFDLSSLTQPQLLYEEVIGAGSYSEAEYNHKAFTWYARDNLLALPITRWSGDFFTDDYASYSVFNGLQVFRVDPGNGFSLIGEVDHSSFYRNQNEQTWYYPDNIRRSFFVSDTEQRSYLYSVSSRGLKVNAMDNLTNDLAALPLPLEVYEYGVLY